MKLWTITMGFVPARIWKQSCDAYYSTRNRETEHIFVDAHYPLKKSENRKELWDICRERGISVLDPGKNLGGTENFNYALSRIPFQDDDVIIGYDPDTKPISVGWDGALSDAIAMDRNIVWTSLLSGRAHPELVQRGYTKRMVGHIEVWKTHRPVVNSICAFRGSWLRKTCGLRQPSPIYGGLEAEMFTRLAGQDWCFLPGWHEEDSIRDQQDKEYLHWKWRYAHLREWHGDFTSYVDAGCPPPSDLPASLP